MSTAGAIHLAESEQWLAAEAEQREPDAPVQPATAPLAEVAMQHERDAPPWYVRHHLHMEHKLNHG